MNPFLFLQGPGGPDNHVRWRLGVFIDIVAFAVFSGRKRNDGSVYDGVNPFITVLVADEYQVYFVFNEKMLKTTLERATWLVSAVAVCITAVYWAMDVKNDPRDRVPVLIRLF